LRYLLDTHVVLWWWIDDPALPAEMSRLLDQQTDAGQPVAVSAISLWEIALLASRGRVALTASIDALLDDIEGHPAVRVVPLSARIAVESTRFGDSYPRDPADRIIGATARCHGLRLVTADQRIRASGLVALA
jgi:PIN domain nuclease of toxin-antitoxin system